MKKDYFSWIKKDPFWIILFIVVLIITIVIFIVNGNTWATQVFAACLGAIITVIVTRLLLDKQAEIDEKVRKEQDKGEHELEKAKQEHEKELRKLEEESKRNFGLKDPDTRTSKFLC